MSPIDNPPVALRACGGVCPGRAACIAAVAVVRLIQHVLVRVALCLVPAVPRF